MISPKNLPTLEILFDVEMKEVLDKVMLDLSEADEQESGLFLKSDFELEGVERGEASINGCAAISFEKVKEILKTSAKCFLNSGAYVKMFDPALPPEARHSNFLVPRELVQVGDQVRIVEGEDSGREGVVTYSCICGYIHHIFSNGKTFVAERSKLQVLAGGSKCEVLTEDSKS